MSPMIIEHVRCCTLCREPLEDGIGGIQVTNSPIGKPSRTVFFHEDCHAAIRGTFTDDISRPTRLTRWLVQAGWVLIDDVLTKP